MIRPASVPPPRTRGPLRSPKEQKLHEWCVNICSQASGSGTQAGMNLLGPIRNSSSRLLIAATSSTCLLAAEQIGHLVEGWRYASAATHALLNHSSRQALHFAYYAELRAAMSLFAFSGIRVKRDDFFYLDSSATRHRVDSIGTHDAVWGLWKQWVNRSDAQSLFLDGIKLHPSISLRDVVAGVRYVNASATLTDWGIDLLDATNDHLARNAASYEAEYISHPLSPMKKDDAELIKSIWSLFLSEGVALRFDAAFVNYVIADAIPKLQMQSRGPAWTYESQLSDVAVSISANTGVDESEFMGKISGAYPSLPFNLAGERKTGVQNVICRSFFLLRLAMMAGKKSMSLSSSTGAKDWVAMWLEQAGISIPGVDAQDLEEDYIIALQEIDFSDGLPGSLWSGLNLPHSAKMSRPDACMAWGLIA